MDHQQRQGHAHLLILRRIAFNLLALFRGRTQRSEDKRLTPWATLLRWFVIALVSATLLQVDGLRSRNAAAAIR